jgi:hypothetical protein
VLALFLGACSPTSQPPDDPKRFLGMTESEMIEAMGNPIDIISGSHEVDGPYKMHIYSNEQGRNTAFVIWESDGVIASGYYRGTFIDSFPAAR